jgi:hypothetical protein
MIALLPWMVQTIAPQHKEKTFLAPSSEDLGCVTRLASQSWEVILYGLRGRMRPEPGMTERSSVIPLFLTWTQENGWRQIVDTLMKPLVASSAQ